MTDISCYNTNTSLCSNLATMVLKIVHYMNVVISRHMAYGHVIKIWSLPLTYAWRKSFVVIADVCHVIFLLFSNTTFHTFSHTGCQQRTQYKQRGYFQTKIFICLPPPPPPTRPKEKYDGHQCYNNIFLFKQTKPLTLTGLHCRSLQTLSSGSSTQNQWFWIKYLTTILFSFHQAKSNIWHMSVLQKKSFRRKQKWK